MRLRRGLVLIDPTNLQYDTPRYVIGNRMYIVRNNTLVCLMKNKSRVKYLTKRPNIYKPFTY